MESEAEAEAEEVGFGNSAPTIIPKIPHLIRETDPTSYTPVLVAIGPYHRNNVQLLMQGMDQTKSKYYHCFLLRNPLVSKENYLQHLKPLIPRVRSYYSYNVQEMEDNELLEMLLVDGCFIVELLLIIHAASGDHVICSSSSSREDDPILGNMLNLSLLKYDMLLLENQLPFFVLEALFDLVDQNECSLSLVQLAIEFLASHLPAPQCCDRRRPTTSFYHILHLFHSCSTAVNLASDIEEHPQTEDDASSDFFLDQLEMIPQATQLRNSANVKFIRSKGGGDSSRLCTVSFKKHDRVMEISLVLLNNNTNTMFRNLIAFEQCFPNNIVRRKTPVIAYVMLMGCLIGSKDDLDLMRRERVLDYTFTYQKASCFFRKLSEDTILDDNRKVYRANLGQLSSELRVLYSDSAHKRWHHKVVLLIVSLMLLQLMLDYFTARRDCTKLHRAMSISFLPFQLVEAYFSAKRDGTRVHKLVFMGIMIIQLLQEYVTSQQNCGAQHRLVFYSFLPLLLMVAYFTAQNDHTKRSNSVFIGLTGIQLMFTCLTALSYYQPSY